MPACPHCGNENPDGFRFCGSCGGTLTGLDAAETREIRKTVTILFSDVTGSTEIGERLDPESVRAVMQRYFNVARIVIERHGGTVEKFIGDAVMAVFGVPVVHEDDALRAVRAAHEMRSALDSLNAELDAAWGVRIRIRTGVNTGPVVAGDASTRQSFATGDTTNVAARLEQAAAPGEVLIGEPTWRLVRDAVTVEAVEPLTLKGKSQPMPAYRLVAVTTSAPGVVRRLDSPIIGRETELARIMTAFDDAIAKRGCSLLAVVGQAGAGKSRLVTESISLLRDRARVISGRCLAYGEGITYWPLAEALREAAGIHETDSADDARAKFRATIGDEPDAELVMARIAAVAGLGDASFPPQETFWAVRRILETVARDQPLVAVIEDIHWAEAALLDCLRHVAGLAGASILILCPARPELLSSYPEWKDDAMILEPLTGTQSEALLANLLGGVLPSETIARIVQTAEGNPLFVEEIIRKLIDEGILVRSGPSWVPTSALAGLTLPDSIDALIASRLDRLDPDDRAALERGAVVGKEFTREQVAELSSPDALPSLDQSLIALEQRELIRAASSTQYGGGGFEFHHVLIREATYRAIPKRLRARLHEEFGDWLERKAGDRLVEYEEILGHHFEQAYRHLVELGPPGEHGEQLAARAARHLGNAGHRAIARNDITAAGNMLARALDLTSADEPSRPALLVVLGAAKREAGDLIGSDGLFRAGLSAAEELGDRSMRAHAQMEIARNRMIMDGTAKVEDLIEEAKAAIALFEELGEEAGIARGWRLISDINNFRGRFDEANVAIERCIEFARRAGDDAEATNGIRILLSDLLFGGTHAEVAITRCREILADETGSLLLRSSALRCLACMNAMRGNFDEARSALSESLRIMKEHGMAIVAAAGIANGVFIVEVLAGNPAEARRHMRESLEFLQQAGDKGYLSTVAAELSEVEYILGNFEDSMDLTLMSEHDAAPDDADAQAVWRAIRAKLRARQGAHDEALDLARESVSISMDGDGIDMQARVRMALADVLATCGRHEEARDVANEAIDLFDRKGNVVAGENARRWIDSAG